MSGDTKDYLKKFELFRHLSDEELGQLSPICVARNYLKGSTIFVPGEDKDKVYFVITGEVKIYQISGGKKITIDLHREGGFFGDFSFAHAPLEAKPANFAEVQKDTLLCVFAAGDLTSYLETHPKLALEMLVGMRNKLHHAESKIRDLALSSAEVRVVNELLRFAIKHGQDKGEYYIINKRLTHQDLSEMTGLARETVTKTLSALARAGMVEVTENRLLRLNRDKILNECLDCLKIENPDVFA